jgi:AmmeMemoRadiSam system protein A
MSSLGSEERKWLLDVARRALIAAAEGRESFDEPPQERELNLFAGAFVTLQLHHRLRGCIGQIVSDQPLVRVVAQCARAAALEDARFAPVRPHEVAGIEIEISVLSPLVEVTPERIEVGKHGLVVSRGWQRGVLLPQVAPELHLSALRFLEETCLKAGLDRDAWKDEETKIQAFTAEIFRESEFAPGAARVASRTTSGYSSST